MSLLMKSQPKKRSHLPSLLQLISPAIHRFGVFCRFFVAFAVFNARILPAGHRDHRVELLLFHHPPGCGGSPCARLSRIYSPAVPQARSAMFSSGLGRVSLTIIRMMCRGVRNCPFCPATLSLESMIRSFK